VFPKGVLVVIVGVLGTGALAMSILQPILPLYLTAVGVPLETIGLMFSVSMVAMAIGECYWGWAADKKGFLIPFIIGTFVCGLVVLSFTLSESVPMLFIVFLLWGLCRSAVFGPGRGILGASAPPMKKATFMAIIAVILSASRSLGALPGGFIAENYGYSFVFICSFGISFLGGFMMLSGLKNIQLPNLTQHFNGALLASKDNIEKQDFKVRSLTAQCLVAFFQFFGMSILFVYLPILATQVIGISVVQVSILFTIKGVTTMLVSIPLASVTDRVGKKTMMIVGILVSAVAMASLTLVTSFGALVIAIIVNSVGFSLFGPAALGLVSSTVPSDRQSTFMGFYGGICENAGIVTGSALGGFIWSAFGPQCTFLTGACTSAFGAIICYFFLKDKFSCVYCS